MSPMALIVLAIGLIAVWNERDTGKYIIGAVAVTSLFVDTDFVRENIVALGSIQFVCGILWVWRWGSQHQPASEEAE